MVVPLHDDNPTSIRPYVTWTLIGACVLIFLWQMLAGDQGFARITYSLGVIPAILLGRETLPPDLAWVPPGATMFTSMFLHGGIMHLLGNMLYLCVFGNNIEEAMGRVRFLAFYLLCGIAAVFAQALPDPSSTIPMIGASGAISGVLGAYMLLFPRARVLLGLPLGFMIIQLGRFPAVWVLAAWFGMQLLLGGIAAGEPSGKGGVAFGAHIGGFVAGLVLVAVFKRRDVPLFGR
jgi:membrane associated rhomboid family serine protease